MHLEAGQLDNVFSPDEIVQLQTILAKLKDSPNSGGFKAYTNGFTENDIIYKIIDKMIVDKIEKRLQQPIKVKCGMHLKELKPWGIHTDYQHTFDKNSQSHMAFLIPLKLERRTETGMTHTVVFNESCQTSFDLFKSSNKKVSNNATSIFEKHCSHCPAEDLEYVTVKGVYAWQPGSVIYWDRELLHCSDNFLANSVIEKQALVLFCGS